MNEHEERTQTLRRDVGSNNIQLQDLYHRQHSARTPHHTIGHRRNRCLQIPSLIASGTKFPSQFNFVDETIAILVQSLETLRAAPEFFPANATVPFVSSRLKA